MKWKLQICSYINTTKNPHNKIGKERKEEEEININIVRTDVFLKSNILKNWLVVRFLSCYWWRYDVIN